MNKHDAKAQETIQRTMREFSEGTLRIGSSGKKVTNRRQAIAIGIAKAHTNSQKAPNKEER